jgi:flagellar basal body-associated protein FliL
MNSKKLKFILVIILLVVLVAGLLVIHRINQESHSSLKSVSKSRTSSQPLTAGGVVVPAYLQTRAKKVGYYCPSWAAKPGQVSTTICMPLDQ